MAIQYVGGTSGGRAGATSTTTQSISGTLTGGLASSPSAGDLVVVWCSAAGDGTGSPTNQTVSGNNNGTYSTGTFQSVIVVTYDTFAQFNYKIQGGTVDTTITIPSSGNVRNAQRWVVHVFRGVDSTTPLDVTPTYATGILTGRPNPAAITPTATGAWILWCGSSAAATGVAYTAPTDFLTDWLGGTTADNADVMDGCGYYTGWTSGSYDPAAVTAGGTTEITNSWVATTVALRPALNNYTLTCNSGSYTYSGQGATLLRSKLLTASAGAYTYAGQSAGFTKGLVLTAQAGNYTYTGQAATLTYTPLITGYTITAQAGNYTITGQGATLNRNRSLTAQAGSYSVDGQPATLLRSRGLIGQAGGYSITGQSATITYTPLNHYTMTALAGSYVLAGQQATITYSGFTPDGGGWDVRARRAGRR